MKSKIFEKLDEALENMKEEDKNTVGLSVNLLNLDNIKKAFAIANNALYFDDSSDYKSALYDVCKTRNPNMEEKIGKYCLSEE